MHQKSEISFTSPAEDIKLSLLNALTSWMDNGGFLPAEAVKKLGISDQQGHALLQRETDALTIDVLVDMLLRAGKHIHITIDESLP
ncbi:XRE family transcriptional regulator [Chromobacterium sp. IIBBL 290-4]|uniref:XRE family transcriptional regulator n=1 Tax=Chromobacterium sp. IIBBL 290-4 TaxID=2953890 RepID=UPI0020B74AF0|nr:XRE family transcriptional regulator [Chromobacterium sp. IIBBL 290-4]UTH75650.1 hypothetical protein NKT35_06015 [Chromobacterium sp. IIBBL 290-4]